MQLKITKVTSATVEGNYPWVYARVYAGDLYGTGEGFHAPELENTITQFGRLLIGEDALQVNLLFEKMYWASISSGYSGTNFHAMSAIETALLDLVGKYRNMPVYSLLGGKLRDKIRVYVDTHAGKALEAIDVLTLPFVPKWMAEGAKVGNAKRVSEGGTQEPIHGRRKNEAFSKDFTRESYARRARLMKKEEGFTAIKFDLDVPTPYTKDYDLASGSLNNKEVRYLSELVAGVREGAGEETDIMFDLHWRYNVQSSIALARAIEPFGVTWLEDPVPPGNPALIDTVARATSTPIASGENLYGRYQFAPLLSTGLRVVTPDAIKAGGLMETRLVAQMAQINEITFSPHNIGSPLGTIAQAHLAATVPNFGVLEFHAQEVPIWGKLLQSKKKGKRVIQNGFIELSEEPGLGAELDEKVAARYARGDRFEL